MKPKSIKRQWMIWAVLMLLLTLAMLLPTLWPRLFPSFYVSDLYRRYEHNPHIWATDLHNFRVNDTLTVDATLLQALDSLGWETLKEDFSIVYPSPQALELLKHAHHSVGLRLTPQNNIGAPADTVNIDNNYLLAIDFFEHSVGIFYTRNKQERDQIFDYHLNNLKTPENHEESL